MPSDPCEALDAVIATLTQPPKSGLRSAPRARVDVAALLCEVAPLARVHVTPGQGTEVFGEPSELRRMLYVLVTQTRTERALVHIERSGDWVKLAVELGPDVHVSLSMELRWLARMAMRHGGRLELHGTRQELWLRADEPPERKELAALRDELEQARRLGVAYAQAVGEAFAETHYVHGVGAGLSVAKVLGAALSPEFEAGFSALDTALRDAEPLLEHDSELHDRVDLAVATLRRAAEPLRALASLDLDEPERAVDVGALLRELIAGTAADGGRRVRLRPDAPGSLVATASQPALTAALRALLQDGLERTPPGGALDVGLTATPSGFVLEVDVSASTPERAARERLADEPDRAAAEPRRRAAEFIARLAAAYLDARLLDEELPQGRSRRTLAMP